MTAHDPAYRRMLSAFGAVGSTKLFSVALGVARTKIVAVLLGPANLGLIGLVASSVELVRVIFSFGLESSVARQVAIASNDRDANELSRIYEVGVRSSVAVGIVSALVLIAASPWLAAFATGSSGNWWLFATAGLALLFSPLAAVQQALAQGLRSLSFITTCQLISGPIVALATTALIYFFGVFGGIVAIVANSAVPFFVQSVFLYRIRPAKCRIALDEFRDRLEANFRHGSGLYINAIWLTAGTWLTFFGIGLHYPEGEKLVQTGYYQAALALGSIYVGIIISAMATDYYPAICGACSDPKSLARLFQQYTVLALHVGTLVSLFTIIWAPHLLQLFYSSEFISAAPTLRLLAISTALRFAFFPIGFVLLAQDRKKLFLIIEMMVGGFTLIALLTGSSFAGTFGAACAHILSSLFQLLLLLFTLRYTTLFWSQRIISEFLLTAFLLVAASIAASFAATVAVALLGTAVIAVYFLYCARLHYRNARNTAGI